MAGPVAEGRSPRCLAGRWEKLARLCEGWEVGPQAHLQWRTPSCLLGEVGPGNSLGTARAAAAARAPRELQCARLCSPQDGELGAQAPAAARAARPQEPSEADGAVGSGELPADWREGPSPGYLGLPGTPAPGVRGLPRGAALAHDAHVANGASGDGGWAVGRRSVVMEVSEAAEGRPHPPRIPSRPAPGRPRPVPVERPDPRLCRSADAPGAAGEGSW